MIEPPQPEKLPLTPLRWFFAIAGGLIMLFAGGFGLYFVGFGAYVDLVTGADHAYMFVLLGLTLGGIPAAFGYAIWWVAVKRGRRRVGEEEVVPPG